MTSEAPPKSISQIDEIPASFEIHGHEAIVDDVSVNSPPMDHVEHDDQKHESVAEPSLRDLPLRLTNLPRLILLAMIRLYQATFSRTLPADTCRFYPSCSHYGYQAIYKYGVLKGGLMAAWRVLRCNPFNSGGFDPVP